MSLPHSGARVLLFAVLCAGSGVRAQDAKVEVTPEKAHPGDAVMITFRGAKSCPQAWLGDRELELFKIPSGCRALAGLPVETPAGILEVRMAPRDASAPELSTAVPVGRLEVLQAAFNVRELRVKRKFVHPSAAEKQRRKEDQEAFDAAFSQPFGEPVFRTRFGLPIDSTVTAPFGDLRTFNGKKQSQHYGMDLDGRIGDPIYAANDGVVVMAQETWAAGNATVISHGAGVYTAYFHQTKMLVKPGDHVKKGQPVGLVGKTGRVTGPHLHFSVKVNGLYVDPASLLELDFAAP